MKYLLYLFVIISQISFGQMDSVFVDGHYRKYLVHLPSAYDGVSDYPVVLGFHGGFGNSEQFEEQSLLSEKADESDFIVVYPDGLGFLIAPNLHFWNAGICCGYPYINDIDDVQFISDLIDTLSMDLNIIEERVYATGISNGAFMAYRLACEIPDKIAAIAPVAGGMVVADCPADRLVPIIHFHSYLDDNIPYDGGIGDGASSHHNPPLDSVFNVWANNDNCTVENDTVYNGADYTFVKWDGCDCETAINYYITADGGHSWPGGAPSALGDPVSITLNANDLMWTFFKQYDVGCMTSSIQEEFQPRINLYPNPSTGIINVAAETTINSIKITNQLGQYVYVNETIFNKNISISLPNLSRGMYIVQIRTNESIASHQLLIE